MDDVVREAMVSASEDTPRRSVTNPRLLLWLELFGLSERDIDRDADGSVARVTVGNRTNLWTVLYSQWIWDKWVAWGSLLGYGGTTPHRLAMADGHKEEEFDAWLREQVQAEKGK